MPAERLARAYDAEDAAQRGEPSPWTHYDCPGPDCEDCATFKAERLACAQVGLDACLGGLFDAIAHGDDEHRAWLKQAIENYLAGRPVNRPDDGSAPKPRDQQIEGDKSREDIL